jgi:hypothetical protein
VPYDNAEQGREPRSPYGSKQVPRLLGQLVVRVILLAAILFGILGAFHAWGHGSLRAWSQWALGVGILGSFALSCGPRIRSAWNRSRRS